MPAPRKFLLVDDNSDGRLLINRTLLRQFPSAAVVECQDADTARELCSSDRFDAILVHQAGASDAVALSRGLRAACGDTPILALFEVDCSSQAIAAGATRFLDYARWLMVGRVTEEILKAAPGG